uniref:Uncharacterized protein n=1 Tax=Arundo donax TaxID=35708 RepID=A0A0A9CAN3_ARUDO
MGRVRIHKRA